MSKTKKSVTIGFFLFVRDEGQGNVFVVFCYLPAQGGPFLKETIVCAAFSAVMWSEEQKSLTPRPRNTHHIQLAKTIGNKKRVHSIHTTSALIVGLDE